MQDEQILSARIARSGQSQAKTSSMATPAAFTNFMVSARDEQTFRRLADDVFGSMGLLVNDVSDLVVADADGQPAEAGAALARITAGEPWGYTTFHVFPHDSD